MSKLAAWYPLHKDTNDWSGNGLHLTEERPVSGHALAVDNGIIGKCYRATKVGITANLKTAGAFKLGGDHAMFCFLNVIDIANISSANGVISHHRHDIYTGMGITLRPTSASQFNLSVNTGHGTNRTFNTYAGRTPMAVNKWYHVGFTWEQKTRTLRLYVDGKLDFESVGKISPMAFDSNSPLVLFGWSVSYLSNKDYRPAQKIQDVRIYQGVPDIAEIQAISKLCFINWSFNQQAYGNVRANVGWSVYSPYATANIVRSDYVKITMKGEKPIAIATDSVENKSIRLSGKVYKNGVPVHITHITDYDNDAVIKSDEKTGWFCAEINSTKGYIIHSRIANPKANDVYEFKELVIEDIGVETTNYGSVRDSSGFKNDGNATSDLPLYTKSESNLGHGCYYFDKNSIYSKELINFGGGNQITLAAFIKSSVAGGVAGYEAYHVPLSIPRSQCELSVGADGHLRTGVLVNGVRQVANHRSGLLDGKWHHIAMTYDGLKIKTFIDGKMVGNVDAVGNMNVIDSYICVGTYYNPKTSHSSKQLYQSNAQIYGRALSENDIKELARQRLTASKNRKFLAHEFIENEENTRVSSRGQLVSPKLIESNFTPSLVDYSQWIIGQSRSAKFEMNGTVAENLITIDSNPHGIPDVVWQTKKVDTVSNADGGFNSSPFSIDKTKHYRFSCWINRKVMGNGTWYLGCYGRDRNGNTALEDFSGNKNSNPYFRNGNPHKANEWFLVVGYVYAAGTTQPVYSDKGTYIADGTRIVESGADFRWMNDSVTAVIRAYLFYSTNLSTVQNFYRPRVDLMDGSQPSIKDLIKCQEHTPLATLYNSKGAFVKHENLSFTKNIVANEFKEF